MDNFMPMSTKIRHNKITMSFPANIFDLLKKQEVHALQEECSLVHWGYWNRPEPRELIDINNIEDMDVFMEKIIDDLDYVQPDFLLFRKNRYITNKRETRTAGRPDLIVEVWSESNSRNHRNFKFDLYSSSPETEHWYIEQDSNEVKCFVGKDSLETQSIENVLQTTNGLTFDLRYLAL
jgi:hypothetical protein